MPSSLEPIRERGGRGSQFEKCASIFVIGGINRERTLWNRQAGNVSILPRPGRCISRSAEWIFFFLPEYLQSARRIWIENVTIPHSIKESTYGMPTQQNAVAEKINEQFKAWLLTILLIKAMRRDEVNSADKTIVDLLLADVVAAVVNHLRAVLCVNCLTPLAAENSRLPLRGADQR